MIEAFYRFDISKIVHPQGTMLYKVHEWFLEMRSGVSALVFGYPIVEPLLNGLRGSFKRLLFCVLNQQLKVFLTDNPS